MATITTPPLRAVAEPPTPRHGPKYDTDEPYLRRRSSRLKSVRTPSPIASDRANTKQNTTSLHSRYHSQPSPPSSPLSANDPSPRRRAKKESSSTDRHSVATYTDRMLPTPTKTPSKKDMKRSARPTSRVLFQQGLNEPVEDSIPRRDRASLYSPGTGPEVEIYMDSNARVPELDMSEENVFYDAPQKRNGKAKAKAKNSDSAQQASETSHDMSKGMWFTFRGRKIWKSYEDEADEYPTVEAIGSRQARHASPPPRFTRTAYQPRTLFPESHKTGDISDEEAITDIEDPEQHAVKQIKADIDKFATTPTKQRFYATPPTTARTTRSTAKRSEDTASEVDELSTSLFTVKKGKKTSPFNDWTRVKGESASGSQEKKRKADGLSSFGNTKRIRSGLDG